MQISGSNYPPQNKVIDESVNYSTRHESLKPLTPSHKENTLPLLPVAEQLEDLTETLRRVELRESYSDPKISTLSKQLNATSLNEHSHRVEVKRVAVDKRFYHQAVRELAMRDSQGCWLYDTNISSLAKSTEDATFSVVLENNIAWFINYSQDDKTFTTVLEKYTEPVPKEFERYLDPSQSEKTTDSKHRTATLAHANSAPLLRTLRASSLDLRDFQSSKPKRPSTPQLKSDFDETYSINGLLKAPQEQAGDHLIRTQLMVAHSPLNEKVYKAIPKSSPEMSSLSKQERELLDEAKKNHRSPII